MKSLKQKIFEIYPQLERDSFNTSKGTILLEVDNERNFIAKWEHPTLPRPSEEQLT
jgi:hypothetical protein